MNEQATLRDRVNRAELTERIAHAMPQDGVTEAMPGLFLSRRSRPSDKLFGVSQPSTCIIAQGAKEVYFGENRYASKRSRGNWG